MKEIAKDFKLVLSRPRKGKDQEREEEQPEQLEGSPKKTVRWQDLEIPGAGLESGPSTAGGPA